MSGLHFENVAKNREEISSLDCWIWRINKWVFTLDVSKGVVNCVMDWHFQGLTPSAHKCRCYNIVFGCTEFKNKISIQN